MGMCAPTPRREREGGGISSTTAREVVAPLELPQHRAYARYTHSASCTLSLEPVSTPTRELTSNGLELLSSCEPSRGTRETGMSVEVAAHVKRSCRECTRGTRETGMSVEAKVLHSIVGAALARGTRETGMSVEACMGILGTPGSKSSRDQRDRNECGGGGSTHTERLRRAARGTRETGMSVEGVFVQRVPTGLTPRGTRETGMSVEARYRVGHVASDCSSRDERDRNECGGWRFTRHSAQTAISRDERDRNECGGKTTRPIGGRRTISRDERDRNECGG